MTHSTFRDLGLADVLLSALDKLELVTPTPIQAQAIPAQLKGRDVLGVAQTGTGKTAAFSLPMLNAMIASGKRAKPKAPLALVLAPTRELALQIQESIADYATGTKLRHQTIFGGVSPRPQVDALARGVDIVVATPGRLLDHMNGGAITLADVRYVVLDEADRMLDMGFVRDVMRIVKALPTERQSLLFSATMPQNVASLAAKILKDPVRVEVTPEVVTVDKIDQSVIGIAQKAKKLWLIRHLADPKVEKVVVFTRTKHGANRLAEDLEKAGVEALAIHGNKSQGARQKALSAFHDGKARVLVATDIVARGIHVDDISHVVNFDLPEEPESYVHRIGRTARAGKGGVAIALVDPSERAKLKGIEKLIGRRFEVVESDIAAPAGGGGEDAGQRRPREHQSRGNGRGGQNHGGGNRQPRGHEGHGGGKGGDARPAGASPSGRNRPRRSGQRRAAVA